jgi:putative membrane protein
MIKKYFPHFLLSFYVVELIWSGINPFSRAVWYAENGPILALVIFITVLYIRKVRFTNLAYGLMFILPFWHTIGSHYTFELVPFDWFNNFFGFERNMFDRIGHFAVGFYALPIMEYLFSRGLVTKKWVAASYAIFAVAFVAVFYEWIEWWYAELYGGSAGAAFLGSQDDIWDAQKDMFMDVSGAVLSVVGYLVVGMFSKKDVENQP